MANIFSGSEIVEIGVQIEKNGKDFYEAVASQSKDKKVKDLFLFLAAEEAKHILVFEKILSQVEKYEPAEAYPGEYFAYMNALARESVFTQKDKGKEIAKKIKSDKEAIEIGIGAEKDSIIFYEGVKKVVPVYGHAVIDEVLAQEQGHLAKFMELKERI